MRAGRGLIRELLRSNGLHVTVAGPDGAVALRAVTLLSGDTIVHCSRSQWADPLLPERLAACFRSQSASLGAIARFLAVQRAGLLLASAGLALAAALGGQAMPVSGWVRLALPGLALLALTLSWGALRRVLGRWVLRRVLAEAVPKPAPAQALPH